MRTDRMGKKIILTKDMLKKMGQKKETRKVSKGGQTLSYVSERIDPRNHVRLS